MRDCNDLSPYCQWNLIAAGTKLESASCRCRSTTTMKMMYRIVGQVLLRPESQRTADHLCILCLSMFASGGLNSQTQNAPVAEDRPVNICRRSRRLATARHTRGIISTSSCWPSVRSACQTNRSQRSSRRSVHRQAERSSTAGHPYTFTARRW